MLSFIVVVLKILLILYIRNLIFESEVNGFNDYAPEV